MVAYFGSPNFGDPTLEPRVEPPAGRLCCWCGEAIQLCDSGVVLPSADPDSPEMPHHEACYVRVTRGSVGHQRFSCPCFGGQLEDPPGLTLRQAAEAALDESYLQGARQYGLCLRCGHARRRHGQNQCNTKCVAENCRCQCFEENLS